MTPADLGPVVEVHTRAFKGFFLTFLGPQFLAELYHAILDDLSGIALVCERSSQLLGFVAGSTQPAGLYRRLLRERWHRFALAALPAVLRRPRTARRLLRALRAPEQVSATAGIGTLMSIAVSPEVQNSGVGRQLVTAFLAEAKERGLVAVDLTTDSMDNEAANQFYRKLGFQLSRTFTTPEGRMMNEYLIYL
jgi:ribosomal protein S18 acetylase RimI-like enzyme